MMKLEEWVHKAFETLLKMLTIAKRWYFTKIEEKRVKTLTQVLNELSMEIGMEKCSFLFKKLSSFKQTEAEIQTEVIPLVEGQLKVHGYPLLFEFIRIINSRQTVLYSTLLPLSIPLLEKNQDFDQFARLSQENMEVDREMAGSVFYILKALLQKLQEDAKPALTSLLTRAVFDHSLIRYSTDASSKNSQRVIDAVVKEFIREDNFSGVSSVLESIEQMGHKPHDVCFNKLLDYICKQGVDMRYSELILNSMIKNKVKASLVTFNTLLDLYVKQRNFTMAFHLFDSLVRTNDPVPDNFTFSIMINGVKYMRNPDATQAERLFELYAERHPVEMVLVNCLLDVFVSLGESEKAQNLISQTIHLYGLMPDAVTYNTLIKDCSRRGCIREAQQYFAQMGEARLTPSKVTFNSMMDVCVKKGRLDLAMEYLKEMRTAGCSPDQFSYSIIFNGMKSNVKEKAVYEKTFAHLGGLLSGEDFEPDEVFFNTMMDVAAKFNDLQRVLSLFGEMEKKDIKPSCITFGILVKAYGRAGEGQKAVDAFEKMQQAGLKPNEITYGCLIEALVNSGDVEGAQVYFGRLPALKVRLNPIILTTMIKGLSRERQYSQAVSLFEEARRDHSLRLNTICFNCMIDIATKKHNMMLASKYLTDMKLEGLAPDLITFSIMIKGTCQEKDLASAVGLLKQMLDARVTPDLPIFNSIIEASSDPIHFKYGFEVYTLLRMNAVRPNMITFGTLVKLHGFARTPQLAFSLLGDIASLSMKPSLILMTNLIHISFANHRTDLVDKAIGVIETMGMKMDGICLEKIVRGYVKLKEFKKADKFRHLLASYEGSYSDGFKENTSYRNNKTGYQDSHPQRGYNVRRGGENYNKNYNNYSTAECKENYNNGNNDENSNRSNINTSSKHHEKEKSGLQQQKVNVRHI